MGLTTALNTSLNGLSLNETQIEVLGNNIANAGTNGFKASNTHFTTQLARTLSVGSAPSGLNGGTNPRQVGLGATTAAIVKDFSQGAISGSTSPSDLAIEGSGFFVLEGNGGRVYSRNGNFGLNTDSKLVNDNGLRVQGYGVDDAFNVVTTQLVDIEIPLGKLNVALETTKVELNGALKTGSGASEAKKRGILASAPLYDISVGPPAPVTDGTIELIKIGFESGTSPLFNEGETISYEAKKGGAILDPVTLTITADTTLNEYMQFMSDALGFPPTSPDVVTKEQVPDLRSLLATGDVAAFDAAADDAAVGSAGVSLINGKIVILSNLGKSQVVDRPGVHLTQTESGSGSTQLDLGFSVKNTDANLPDGESVVVTFPVYDSLGEQIVVRMHAVMEERPEGSDVTTYRYYFESADDSDRNIFLGSGTLSLDGGGKLTGSRTATVQINREDTAANDMQIEVDFGQISGLTPGQDTSESDGTLNLLSQDGAPAGTLSSFNINEAGVISGVFTNGVIRTLGQLMLAQFPNTQGLVENGSGTFIEGVSSGPAQLVAPGTQGSGSLRAGAIELSNTDVGRSLVDLIVASTNYRGNARVISSVQQLVDELLVLGR